MAANAALYYHPDGFDTATKMMGRQAAGESLLRALAQAGEFGPVIGAVGDQASGQAMLRQFTAMGGDPARLSTVGVNDQAALARVGCLMRPDPILTDHAWRRFRLGRANAYSLCGLTHTVSSQGPADGFGAMLIAPTEPWDAVICTSVSVKRVVQGLMEGYGAYFEQRFGLAIKPRLELPVIPLGVNSGDFAPELLGPQRQAWRQRLGIGQDDFAILFMGRLSFHAKANPAAMMQAAELCAQAMKNSKGPKVHLIFAGTFFTAAIEQAFRAGPGQFCPSVPCHFVDGTDAQARRFIWGAADAFISLVDNIQETFGLAPLEAMAAGLPVVVSDWNGYRETVRDGEDGMLVASLAGAPGSAPDLAAAFADGGLNYDRYIGAMSNLASIDIDAAARALIALASDRVLRQRLGANGRDRARQLFDWRKVLKSWRDLWDELAVRRQQAAPGDAPGRLHPLRPDPTQLFADYPSAYLRPGSRLALRDGWDWPRAEKALASPLFSHSVGLLASPGDMQKIHAALAARPELELGALIKAMAPMAPVKVARAVLMLCKIGAARAANVAVNATKPGPL